MDLKTFLEITIFKESPKFNTLLQEHKELLNKENNVIKQLNEIQFAKKDSIIKLQESQEKELKQIISELELYLKNTILNKFFFDKIFKKYYYITGIATNKNKIYIYYNVLQITKLRISFDITNICIPINADLDSISSSFENCFHFESWEKLEDLPTDIKTFYLLSLTLVKPC